MHHGLFSWCSGIVLAVGQVSATTRGKVNINLVSKQEHLLASLSGIILLRVLSQHKTDDYVCETNEQGDSIMRGTVCEFLFAGDF